MRRAAPARSRQTGSSAELLDDAGVDGHASPARSASAPATIVGPVAAGWHSRARRRGRRARARRPIATEAFSLCATEPTRLSDRRRRTRRRISAALARARARGIRPGTRAPSPSSSPIRLLRTDTSTRTRCARRRRRREASSSGVAARRGCPRPAGAAASAPARRRASRAGSAWSGIRPCRRRRTRAASSRKAFAVSARIGMRLHAASAALRRRGSPAPGRSRRAPACADRSSTSPWPPGLPEPQRLDAVARRPRRRSRAARAGFNTTF